MIITQIINYFYITVHAIKNFFKKILVWWCGKISLILLFLSCEQKLKSVHPMDSMTQL